MAPPAVKQKEKTKAAPAQESKRPAWLLPVISTAFTLSLLWRQFSQRPPFFGVSTPIANSNPTCSRLHADILHNCEDIRFVSGDSPWALLSCDQGRRGWSPTFNDYDSSVTEGELFLWNWRDAPDTEPVLLPFKGAADVNGTTAGDFHPLGVSIVPIEGEATKHRIFVANQARRFGLVEVLDFDIGTSSFTHVQTIRNPRIHSPNAIVALDQDHFFTITDLYFSRNWAPGVIVESLFGLPIAEVFYVALTEDDEGKRGARVQLVSKIAVGTGIEIDRESKTLWASSLTNGIYEYGYGIQPKKDGEEASDPLFPLAFTPTKFIRTPFWPDNIILSPTTKKLTVSGVVSVERFFKSMISSGSAKPPSWTIELLPAIGKQDLNTDQGRMEMGLRLADPANTALRRDEVRWKTVFWDNGTTLGGVSTGAVVDFGKGREGYIGVSLVDDGVVVCKNTPKERGWLVKAPEHEHEEL